MGPKDHRSIDVVATCECGAVTVALRGHVTSMFQCSCLHCQKTSGGGHSSVILVPTEALLSTGTTKSYSRPADSGATFTRHFCPECSTTVYAQSSRAPSLCIVPVGLLAGQNNWFDPSQLIFAVTQPAWDLVHEVLPRHDAYRVDETR